jgi:hypothetical protein
MSWAMPEEAYPRNVFPRMHPHQLAIPVTGSNAKPGMAPSGHLIDPRTAKNWTLDQYDRFCAENAREFLAWALREPRVGGMFP